MKPVEDLFHQVVYLDTDFIVIAIYTEAFPEYHVYSKRTGAWIGCTNCIFYMPQCRHIMKYYKENYL